jgi:TonB family protein
MRKYKPAVLSAITATLIICALFARLSASVEAIENRIQSETAQLNWLRFAPQGEEFSVSLPAQPSRHDVTTDSDSYRFVMGGERIRERRVYNLYQNGVTFFIECYMARNTQRALQDLIASRNEEQTFERNVNLNGLNGYEYRFARGNRTDFSRKAQYFAARNHVYVFQVAARDETNQGIQQFLSSIRLGQANTAASNNVSENRASSRTGALGNSAQDEIITSRQATNRYVLLWKPEPHYTEQARRNEILGTITLRAILSASGRVSNIQVVSGLPHGLTEQAIEAAQAITFLPSRINGRDVSTHVTLQYMFSMY